MAELVITALGSLENEETENQPARNAFSIAAVDRSGAAAIFEVRGPEATLLETNKHRVVAYPVVSPRSRFCLRRKAVTHVSRSSPSQSAALY